MVDACQHNNFYTGMNYKLLDPYTKNHAALESAASTHLQCSRQPLLQYENKWRSTHRLFSPNEAISSTCTRIAFGFSSRQPNAPDIMQRSHIMQLALTCNALPTKKAPLSHFAIGWRS
eukprot:COSAG02_NODE_2273_length_9263_cov_10.296377_6_plen_118_part_00